MPRFIQRHLALTPSVPTDSRNYGFFSARRCYNPPIRKVWENGLVGERGAHIALVALTARRNGRLKTATISSTLLHPACAGVLQGCDLLKRAR